MSYIRYYLNQLRTIIDLDYAKRCGIGRISGVWIVNPSPSRNRQWKPPTRWQIIKAVIKEIYRPVV